MRKGFSLVEMAMVLVVIGLLVGGILGGQSLIHASEVRKTVTELNKIKAGVVSFRDQYGKPPGDLQNATSYWGAADSGDGIGADCQTVVGSSSSSTCNGDGNGKIDTAIEYYRAWQHLALAGLSDVNLTGAPGSSPSASGYDDRIGTNVPQSSLDQRLGYSMNSSWYAAMYVPPQVQLAVEIAPCCNSTYKWLEGGGVVRSTDAFDIDQKIDDGKPGAGNFQIYTPYGGYVDTMNYNLTTGTTVLPIFALGF